MDNLIWICYLRPEYPELMHPRSQGTPGWNSLTFHQEKPYNLFRQANMPQIKELWTKPAHRTSPYPSSLIKPLWPRKTVHPGGISNGVFCGGGWVLYRLIVSVTIDVTMRNRNPKIRGTMKISECLPWCFITHLPFIQVLGRQKSNLDRVIFLFPKGQ